MHVTEREIDMAVKIDYVDSYKQYGRCLRISNGALEILVTIELGPRIIYFGAPGGVNMFFNDDNNVRVTKGELIESVFGEGAEYHFYGGHRTWLAPQLMIHTTVPDNDPVPYELIENGVILKPAVLKVIGMRYEMRIVMHPDDAGIDVSVTYINESGVDKSYAVWQISQFAAGGMAIIPLSVPRKPFDRSKKPTMEQLLTPLMPSTQITSFLGAFTNDPRLTIDPMFMTLRMDPSVPGAIKLGTPNIPGYAMYVNNGYVATIRSEYEKGKTYTDMGCGLETYTDNNFLELEMLGPYETIKNGASTTHTETLTLQPAKMPAPKDDDREGIRAFVEAHL